MEVGNDYPLKGLKLCTECQYILTWKKNLNLSITSTTHQLLKHNPWPWQDQCFRLSYKELSTFMLSKYKNLNILVVPLNIVQSHIISILAQKAWI